MLNPFSVVLIILIIYHLLKDKSAIKMLNSFILLTIWVELFIEAGYFIKIGGSDINYRTICELVTFFIAISVRNKKLNHKFKYGLYFLSIIVIGLVLTILIPSEIKVSTINVSWDDVLVNGARLEHPRISSFVLQQILQFIIFAVILITINSCYSYSNYIRLLKDFTKIIKVFIVFSCVEAISKYLFHFESWGQIVQFIFGLSDSTTSGFRVRGSGIALSGFTKEASHYAYSLFVCCIIIFASDQISNNHKNTKWIIICLILMGMCMSFSSVLFVIGLICIYLLFIWNSSINEKKVRQQQIVVTTIIISIIFLFITSLASFSIEDGFFARRIISLFQEFKIITSNAWQNETTSLEWSNRVRLLSVYMTLKAFLERPLWGFGLGTVTSHGATSMMLAGTGILGLYYWTKLAFSPFMNMLVIPNKTYIRYAIIIFLLINLLNSLALRPFYELHTILLVISFYFLYDKSKIQRTYNDNHSRI